MGQGTPGQRPDGRFVLTALALMSACWGLLGWLDVGDRGQAGYRTDGINLVTEVRPDSPAESAGLAAGDRITHIDGVSTRDSAAVSRLPVKGPGDRQTLTVERGDEQRKLIVTYGGIPELDRSTIRASLLVACGFIFAPLLAFLRHPSDATRVLTLMGIGLGVALIDGPLIADFTTRAISSAVITLFVLFGLAAMLRFLILFPPLSAAKGHWFGVIDTRHLARHLVYLPAFLLWLLLAWRLLFTPAASPLQNFITQAFAGLIMGAYLLGSLYRFLRNYSRTDRAQRKALALNGMLWGTIAGVLPGLVARLVEAFSPNAALPGQDYYFVSLVLIPLTWARSASRAGRGSQPERILQK